jgi:hypothetical protein
MEINNVKIRRMMFKKGVIFLASLILLMSYMITATANAYNRDQKNKKKLEKFMRNPYSFNSWEGDFSR